MTPERLIRQDHDLEPLMDDGELSPIDRPRTSAAAGKHESNAQLGGLIQRQGAGEATGDIETRISAAQGGGQALPEETRQFMEERIGADFSDVRVHTGGEASQLNKDLQAQAFTHGADIYFADGKFDPTSTTGQQLLAHELTHVVQQGKAGDASTAPKLTIGSADSPAEQEADAVAAKVTDVMVTKDPAAVAEAEAKPAETISAAPAGAAEDVQAYTDKSKIQGQYARVSDNGHVVVLGQSNYSQDLFASAAMIDSANNKLAASGKKGSYLRLVRTGDSLEHAGHTLEKVAPVFKPQGDADNAGLADENKGKDEDDKMSLYADCGRSSRVVMGSHGDASPHGTYNSGGKQQDTRASSNPATYSDEIYLRTVPQFLADPKNANFLQEGIHYNGDKTKIIKAADADQARAQYWELGEEGRRAFDRVVGINTGANPDVGGGYTLNTEYNMPGFKEKGNMTWNFHWAGVVMKDGSDNITLENYADGNGYDSINTEWNFQMYGTVKKGQSFQEEHLASNTHGSRGSAFAVEPDGS